MANNIEIEAKVAKAIGMACGELKGKDIAAILAMLAGIGED